MSRSAKGALLLLLLGLAILGGGYVLLPMVENQRQTATSDAAQSKGRITIGVDSFVGYFPLCSPHLRQLMLAEGYLVDCLDDGADSAGRFANLRKGSLDFAVATVDSYVSGGQRSNYPGVVISVIDESKGGDAIVARADVVQNLTALQDRADLKVAFTPNSPSHYLLKAVGVHFDIPLFRSQDNGWRIETNGSDQALKKLLDGSAQVAVLWEPDVSKALAQPGMVKLLGSDQTDKLIVDILLANRDVLDQKPDQARLLLRSYYKTLRFYRQNTDAFAADVAAYSGLSKDLAAQTIKGVHWITLHDNATQWMGVSQPGRLPQHGLFDSVERTIEILKEVGELTGNPLPNGDPRQIINSSQVSQLFTQGVGATSGPALLSAQITPLEAKFPPLDSAGWNALREFGTLKVRPIVFQSGTATLGLGDKRELDKAAEALKSYPGFRIEVRGHTKPGGDPTANRQLSQQRADAVARYLQVTYGIDANRLRAIGMGSDQPTSQKAGEKYRAWQDRQARVEVTLMQEIY